MLPLLIPLAILHAPDEPPRLRTLLPGGGIVLVERIPGASSLSVQLFAGGASTPETAGTHGWRHLLEHFIAQGASGAVDEKLEERGAFLRAQTLRDALHIEITAKPGDLDLCLAALQDCMGRRDLKEEDVEREARIIASELALQDDSFWLGSAAWARAYGEAGLDPFGRADTVRGATPAKLRDLRERQLDKSGLVLVITGDVDLDDATAKGRKVIELASSGTPRKRAERPPGTPGREVADAFGEARGAIVPGFREPRLAWALAAALAVASEVEDTFVSYTPSVQNALIVVGRTGESSGLGLWIDRLTPAERDGLFRRGRILARRWMEEKLATPAGAGFVRGLLLTQDPAARPEDYLANVDRMTLAGFREGMDMLSKSRSVIVAAGR